jgi:hypothetical protein
MSIRIDTPMIREPVAYAAVQRARAARPRPGRSAVSLFGAFPREKPGKTANSAAANREFSPAEQGRARTARPAARWDRAGRALRFRRRAAGGEVGAALAARAAPWARLRRGAAERGPP